MSATSYKLVYFEARAAAEVSRFIFAQAGVAYEDKRVVYEGDKEEWTALKPNTPTGMLPILEVESKQLVGSEVIARFLAERFGLAGSNDLENAEIAGIVDVQKDLKVKLYQVMFSSEKCEEKKAEMKKKFEEEDVPKYCGILEGMCKKNNSPDGWIYDSKPTYADFAIYCTVDMLTQMLPNLLEQYPCVAKLSASVEALPNIAKWIKERPENKY